MVNGFFRYAKRDRLFGRRRNMREDPTIRSRKGGRAAKAVLRILLVLLNLLITAVAAESTAPGDLLSDRGPRADAGDAGSAGK